MAAFVDIIDESKYQWNLRCIDDPYVRTPRERLEAQPSGRECAAHCAVTDQ
jgi:hypothetical protein